MPVKRPLGVFVRDGQSREAYTPGEATSLRNAGWRLVGEQGPEPYTVPEGVRVLSADETAAARAIVTPPVKPKPKRRKPSQRAKKDAK